MRALRSTENHVALQPAWRKFKRSSRAFQRGVLDLPAPTDGPIRMRGFPCLPPSFAMQKGRALSGGHLYFPTQSLYGRPSAG